LRDLDVGGYLDCCGLSLAGCCREERHVVVGKAECLSCR
jgi:hypothetical protein